MTRPKGSGRTTQKKAKSSGDDSWFSSFDDLLNSKKANRVAVPICLDPALADQLYAAQHDQGMAEQRRARIRLSVRQVQGAPEEMQQELIAEYDDELEKAKAEVARIEQLVIDKSVTFVFEAIGNDKLDLLMREFPATKEQVARAQKAAKSKGIPVDEGSPLYNEDEFPPVLLQECCVGILQGRHQLPIDDDVMAGAVRIDTVEQAKELWTHEKWSRGELGTISAASWRVNEIAV